MIAQLQRWWLSRTAQERRVMATGGIVLVLLLVVGLGILPLLNQHAGLSRRLPGLRQRAVLLEAQADEAVALRARVLPASPGSLPTGPGGLAAPADLQAQLDAAGLRNAGDTVAVQAGGRFELRLARVDFDAFLGWLARLRAATGLGAATLEADSLEAPGNARIHCILAPAGGR